MYSGASKTITCNHVDGSIDPIRDKEVIDIELQLKDLETVESRMSKVKKAAQTGDKEAVKQMGFFHQVGRAFGTGKSARGLDLEEFEEPLMKEMQLLTSKPILYVCNVDEASVVDGNVHVDRVREVAASEGAGVLVLGAAIEADIASWRDPEERSLFSHRPGLEEPGVAKLIQAAYSLLELQTYFTAGRRRSGRGPSEKDSLRHKLLVSFTLIFKRDSSVQRWPNTWILWVWDQNLRSRRLAS